METKGWQLLLQKNIISPYDLYEKFNSTNASGLVSTQFLDSHNAYFGRDINISKDVITEFNYNLSMMTLSVSKDSVQMNFDSTTNFVKDINILIWNEGLKFKNMKRADHEIINNDINNYEYKLIKTPNKREKVEKVQESIV